MKCPNCNADLRDNVRFCGICGKPVNSMTSTPSSQSGMSFSSSLTPGSHLQNGRYLVKKILGQGGMGAALLATDIRLDNKPVVIKEMLSDNTDPTQQMEDVRNFKREVSTLAHIDHPLVPNVTDHFQEGTHYFMVQEYVEGENLEERLDRTQQPLPEREALICASEILDVLDYLAQQVPPIVHRDIKPANIIIGTRDRRAHLVDFGIARAEEIRNAQRKQTAALGTPGYAPPEQYQGNADPRSDLYALAATLHHLLTNRDPRLYPPFSYPSARSLNPQLSPEINEVLTTALNNNIQQRYQSASEMKEAIDSILRQHFGLSGNIDSYTLGNSGAMPKLPPRPVQGTSQGGAKIAAPTPPTMSQPPVRQQVPPTPVQQWAPQPQPSYMAGTVPTNQFPAASPQKRRSRAGWYVLIAVILIAAIVVTMTKLHPSTANQSAAHGPTTHTSTGIGITMINNEPIGISDGTVAFDTTLADGALKTQAAQQLKQDPGDPNAVISTLNQATGLSSNDAEALIYKEDLNVIHSGNPYVTLVVATMLSGSQSTIAVGRDDLQGAYVAQKEYNDASKLRNGAEVRLLIANSGSQTSYVTQVAQQIVQLAQHDKTFVGVMGWPFSTRTQAALTILKNAHIPMVSQTSSDDGLTNSSPYFFRVVPSNKIQGVEGASYATTKLNAHAVALFYDPQDSYSQSLAQDFRQSFEQNPQNKIVVEEKYTVGKSVTVAQAIQDALTKNIDLIYFSGYASDISTLLSNLPSGNIPVLGGDALYELGGYQSSARANFSRLHFTSFAYPDEWDVQGYSAQKPAFFTEYSAAFNPNGQHPGGAYGFTRASSDVMLSYDATVTLLSGYNDTLNTGKTTVTPQDLQQGLLALNGKNSIQGVSGQIALGPNGDPIDKAIVVLYVDPQGHIHMEPTVLNRFLKQG